MRKKIDWKIMRKKVDWKDVGKRAGKTFVQAFVASAGVYGEQIVGIRDLESAKAVMIPVVVGGISAGISAVWNLAVGYFKNIESEGKCYDKEA